jgi:hypothetical protein
VWALFLFEKVLLLMKYEFCQLQLYLPINW